MRGEPHAAGSDESSGLLRRGFDGDSTAFDELFGRHRAALLRAVARRLGPSLRNRFDPSDVVQEAQVEALERLEEYAGRRPMPFRSWLLRTALQRVSKLRRHATAARRDRGREQPLEIPGDGSSATGGRIAASDSTPSRRAAARDVACRLHAVLDRLPEPDRAILGMRTFEGLSYEEAASRLEIDPAAAQAIRPCPPSPPRRAGGRGPDGVPSMNGRLTSATSPEPAAEPSSSSASAATLVARAADEYLERIAAGEVPDVAEFVRRYPQVAGVLPQVLPALELLRTLAPAEAVPEALGEFRILREIGRGGMGVVYEAVQISLGRRVALKVLLAGGMVDVRSLTRFQVEAQIMGALHHPHIVPIFAVGYDRGTHYYAMQLVEGCSLAERLGGSGRDMLTPREAARLSMQAAGALEHAHALGILHRDIKPGNLMVDDGGHIWVTDFGLARLEGVADRPGGGGLTESGDRPGTLRYMSPEQAAGGRVLDPRSDVYSLGATLYELLAGRPAFDGTDRAELLRRIAHDEPAPPRRLDPAIPRDLETIVGKAMAKEPERRYATAGELADDLGRFLDDRPIRARRPGPAERLGRWSRRHGKAMASAATLLVLAVLASAFVMVRLWDAQRRAHSAFLTAEEARRHERQALLFTFKASDQIADRALARIATTVAAQDPDEQRRDRGFCRSALGYYEEIAGRYRRDAEMQPIVAAADHRIGFIRMLLEEPGAEDAHRRSIALYRTLVAASPRDAMLRSAMARTCYDLIILLRKVGRADEVLDIFPTLLGLRRGLVDDFPDDADNLISLTLLQAEYAGLLQDAGRAGEAARVRRQLADIYRLAFGAKPRDPAANNQLAWLLVSRPEAVPSDPVRVIELAELAVAAAPTVGAYWNTLGVAHYRDGDWSAAVDALEESMRLRSGGDPYDWLFLAMARHRLGDAAEARRWLDRSLAWIEAHAPPDADLIRFRAEALWLLGPETPTAPGRSKGDRPAG